MPSVLDPIKGLPAISYTAWSVTIVDASGNLGELAAVFHRFYDTHKVIIDDKKLMLARLSLVHATRIVLANGLRLLNVSIPDKM